MGTFKVATTCTSDINLVGFYAVLLQLILLNYVLQASVSIRVDSCTSIRGITFVFHYYSLGGDTAMPGGLYAKLCHAFLVFLQLLQFC